MLDTKDRRSAGRLALFVCDAELPGDNEQPGFSRPELELPDQFYGLNVLASRPEAGRLGSVLSCAHHASDAADGG